MDNLQLHLHSVNSSLLEFKIIDEKLEKLKQSCNAKAMIRSTFMESLNPLWGSVTPSNTPHFEHCSAIIIFPKTAKLLQTAISLIVFL